MPRQGKTRQQKLPCRGKRGPVRAKMLGLIAAHRGFGGGCSRKKIKTGSPLVKKQKPNCVWAEAKSCSKLAQPEKLNAASESTNGTKG